MFDPTKEVPNLELCRRLKELGFPQEEGGWYWINGKLVFLTKGKKGYLVWDPENVNYYLVDEIENFLKAPTCRELGEWLPTEIECDGKIFLYRQTLKRKEFPYWIWYGYRYEHLHSVEADTEPNARAKMLIWLAENGYVRLL